MSHVKLCLVTLLSVFTLGLSANGQDQVYHITVRIDGISDSVAYLGYHYGNQKYIRDTARVENSTLVFSGDKELVTGVYFIYTPKIFLELIAKDQEFTIQTDTADLVGHFKVKGSPENQLFGEFKSYMAGIQRKYKDLTAQLSQAANRDDSMALSRQMEELNTNLKDFKNGLIENNPETFVAKVLRMNEKVEVPETITDPADRFYYYREHYFDNIDFTDASSLRTPVFDNIVTDYFENLTIQHPDSIIKASDYVLSLATDSDVFRYVLVNLANKYETSKIMGMENVFVYLAENYYLKGKAEWADSTLLAKIGGRVADLKPNLIGNMAPQMSLLDTLLHPVSLNEMNQDYLVLYFYDPNCGHCKKMTPVLRKSYDGLRQLGTEVVAICTTSEIDRWKQFIQQNDLIWTNLADPYFHSNFRKEYNVVTTPTIYILDRNKKIIAKSLGVDQIPDFIQNRVDRENKLKESN